MRQESNLKPKNKFEIENIEDNRCEVVFFDLENIVEEKRTDENNEEQIVYLYNSYRENMSYNSNIVNYLEANYEALLNEAKEKDYNRVAEEVRTKRNAELEATDKEMVLDRLNITIPESISIANIVEVIKSFFQILSEVKNSEWAKYRQELRDITKQDGFPYNVKFPQKPTGSKEVNK